jgi:hypothetical protein
MTQRFSIGQISDMQVPDDWVKVEQDDPGDLSSLILFTPPDDQSVYRRLQPSTLTATRQRFR